MVLWDGGLTCSLGSVGRQAALQQPSARSVIGSRSRLTATPYKCAPCKIASYPPFAYSLFAPLCHCPNLLSVTGKQILLFFTLHTMAIEVIANHAATVEAKLGNLSISEKALRSPTPGPIESNQATTKPLSDFVPEPATEVGPTSPEPLNPPLEIAITETSADSNTDQEERVMTSGAPNASKPVLSYPKSNLTLVDRFIDQPRSLRVAVIGGGLSGVLAGILLPAKVPNIQLTIYEKNNDFVR